MGKRLTAIATRTGDDGTTGLGDGTQTRKDTLRVAAMGDVDELNSSIGLLLTAAGIYGVLAFAVTRRARELAVRLAIGATDRDVIRLITTHTSRLVGTGALIGVAITFALSRVVRAGGGAGSLYDPAPIAFLVPVVILIAIGFLASWIPSRRALKINPAIVLSTT